MRGRVLILLLTASLQAFSSACLALSGGHGLEAWVAIILAAASVFTGGRAIIESGKPNAKTP